MKRPSVIFQPDTSSALAPEMLSDSATLVRRIIEISDGDATTAVLAQSMAQNEHRVLAAATALRAQVIYVSSQADLIKVAKALCFDEQMTDLLGVIYSIVGRTGL